MKKILISCCFAALIIACAGKEKTTAPATGNVVEGEAIFKKYCIICHGIDGKLGVNGAKDLSLSKLTLEEREVQVKKGKNVMTPFEGILNDEQIKAVATYTLKFK